MPFNILTLVYDDFKQPHLFLSNFWVYFNGFPILLQFQKFCFFLPQVFPIEGGKLEEDLSVLVMLIISLARVEPQVSLLPSFSHLKQIFGLYFKKIPPIKFVQSSIFRFLRMDIYVFFQLLSCAWLFVIPRTTACQASLSFTISLSWPKLMPIESMMTPNHFILSPPSPPALNLSINESVPCIRWPKCWSISSGPSNE